MSNYRWREILVSVVVLFALATLGGVGQVSAQDADVQGEVQTGQPIQMSLSDSFDIHSQGLDLRLVLQQLSVQGKRNIVATREVTGEVTADLYGVTFKEALEAVLHSTGYVYREKGDFVYIYTPEQLQAIEDAGREMKVEVFHLSYVRAEDARNLIAPALSEAGRIETTPASKVGIASSETDAGGDAYATDDVLIVKDYEENLKQIAEIIAELDIKPRMVLIEAMILSATLTENNALGIDFNTLSGIDFAAMTSATTGLTSIAPAAITGAALPSGTGASTIRTDFNSGVPAGGLTMGYINSQIGVFVRALETVTDVTVLASPKLPILNKQRGQVLIGNKDGYLTTTVTESAATQTVDFIDTGTSLIVRPFIGRNGIIRLEIHAKDSEGGVTVKGDFVLPSEKTTEVTTNVLVRDGQTLVIGGLFREKTTTGRSQVPLLGDIPILGSLFRRTNDETVREEIIILLTPRIIKQELDEAESEKVKQDVERMRIGQRKGLQWWTRSRMAQYNMRLAKRAMADGHRGFALWYTDMALALQPRMMDAIRLHEQLSEKAYWAGESKHSATKELIQRMILNELDYSLEPVPADEGDSADDQPAPVDQVEPQESIEGMNEESEQSIEPQAMDEGDFADDQSVSIDQVEPQESIEDADEQEVKQSSLDADQDNEDAATDSSEIVTVDAQLDLP